MSCVNVCQVLKQSEKNLVTSDCFIQMNMDTMFLKLKDFFFTAENMEYNINFFI